MCFLQHFPMFQKRGTGEAAALKFLSFPTHSTLLSVTFYIQSPLSSERKLSSLQLGEKSNTLVGTN